jgi:hypothetical protein
VVLQTCLWGSGTCTWATERRQARVFPLLSSHGGSLWTSSTLYLQPRAHHTKSENIILSEVSQAQKAKGCIFSLMWNIGPMQIQAILYVDRNLYRTCIQRWDW